MHFQLLQLAYLFQKAGLWLTACLALSYQTPSVMENRADKTQMARFQASL